MSTSPVRGLSRELTLSLLRREENRAALLIPVLAYAVSAALTLTVLGGARSFLAVEGELQGIYRVMAALATVVLVFPLASLAGGAARLSMRRRDERLSSLRLLGAPRALIRRMTVLEAAVLAGTGVLLGIGAYLLLMPLFGVLTFAGRRLTWHGLWIGWPGLAAVAVALVLLGALSAAVSLRAVTVTPLGVRVRARTVRPHVTRLVIAALFFAAALAAVLSQRELASHGIGVVMVVLLVIFGGGPMALSVVGPWILRRRCERQARRAPTAARLLAARAVLEDPRVAWRQVSSVSVVAFIGVLGGVGMAMADAAPSGRPEERILARDISTGVLLTLGIAFLCVACSVALHQAATALDRRDLYVGLDRAGAQRPVLAEARRREVMSPLALVLTLSAGAAALLALPVVGVALVVNPLAIGVLAGVLALGVLLVRLGASASEPVVSSLLARARRAE